jgi:hypothetical protein
MANSVLTRFGATRQAIELAEIDARLRKLEEGQ